MTQPLENSKNRPIRFSPDAALGLTTEQVQKRIAQGLANGEPETRTKSVRQILRENLLTPFNLLNLILGMLVFLAGSYKNMLFLGVAFFNTLIGVFQEIQAKRTIDKLSLIAAPKARVIRNGAISQIPVNELVLDDVCLLEAGNQVCADCIVMQGGCEVNESLITGESDPISKSEGELCSPEASWSADPCAPGWSMWGRKTMPPPL